LFVGYTSGAVLEGIKQLNAEGVFNNESVVVAIFPDHGSKYMSKVYNNEWMEQQGFMEKNKSKESEIHYVK
jgi:cystathionine beta-synthase